VPACGCGLAETIQLQAKTDRVQAISCFGFIRHNHETFNWLVFDETLYDFRDIRDRDVSIKKVIGFN